MQRAASAILGAAVLALVTWVTVESMHPVHPKKHDAEVQLDAGPPVVVPPIALGFDAGVLDDLPPPPPIGPWDGGLVGQRMPDGTPVPPLPDGAPKSVRVGVVMVTYAGAQGAGATARSKGDAMELAAKLAADAKSDFHGAVRRGDDGSADDVGRIPRGVLELAVEYSIFTLPVGQVGGPIDTPRGFWIVKRIE
jgi:hypothetical protein